MNTKYVDSHKVDTESQVILQILHDRQESVSTGDLRRQTDLDQNQQVKYRITNHLVPAGLVEKSGTRQMPKGSPDATLWSITTDGSEFAVEHSEDIEKARDAAQAIDSLQRTRETVDSFSDDVEDAQDKIERWQETMNDRGKRLHYISERQDELESELTRQNDEAWNKAQSANSNAQDALDAVGSLSSDVDDLEDDLDAIRDDLDDKEQWLDELSTKMTQASKAFKRVKQENRELQRELNEVREIAEEALDEAEDANTGVFKR